MNTAVGDEGGFAPRSALEQARRWTQSWSPIEKAGFSTGNDILLGLDVASSEFYSDGMYNLESEGKTYDAAGFSAFLAELADAYPIISIEDGMDESDWDGWKLLTEAHWRPHTACRRRPVRYQYVNFATGYRRKNYQFDIDKT